MSTHIVAINGSLRAHSRTEHVAKTALRGAMQPGITTELINLYKLNLPVFDNRVNTESYPPGVQHFLGQMRDASGFIFVTPVYHGTMSGAFKNALDFLYLVDPEVYQGKVVGLVSVAGGAMSVNTINTLDYIARALHLWRTPTTVAVSGDAITSDGELCNPDIIRRLQNVGREVSQAAQLLLDTAISNHR
ncbi:MAG: NAD(P)H-dependent oxidoreductase [Chloroflexota bacterium]